ncbi:DPP IV N-terminal domain-containing protein [Mucilaginibacter sp. L3T2-6]|uniref:S9 family peptidase n=1 Tax=Mucilaginibacter sp. L3T2-6 TaxID=3062491 RepID=UPI002674E30C|nr:DPP IV N-terminal domain-containing protein [Mucilaginibacter sp. L3T2-6]MDO3643185.1 DPP IV N-terminal domain-containing protein [Mucilaginibacter sp. L3T2-6]MDV6215509.1 DPP IV N-terminal domain-containing protein [Mucilaginibacter sp. L3T2-6]
MIKKCYQSKLVPLFLLVLLLSQFSVRAQRGRTHWAADGYQYYRVQDGNGIVELDTRDPAKKTVLVSNEMLTPPGKTPLKVSNFSISEDGQKVLLFTNTRRVWRYNTRGDYWVYDMAAKTLKQLGAARPESSLMFAKLSPDGKMAAYVSEHNLFTEDLTTGAVKQLTTDGSKNIINGTFDWAYEEEFDCRDGFRWSPDSRSIAFWQMNTGDTKKYLMLNTTDSIYPYVIPVEYPVAGENPSSCKVAVVDVNSGKITFMDVPGDPIQHYIPRMEWTTNPNEIILEQLNRAQTESRIFTANISNGTARVIHTETDKAWIDGKSRWNGGDPVGWEWINKGKEFLWISEKDGWRHISKINRDGKETLITKGNYDVEALDLIDEANGYIYFMASPDNATQRYLYRIKLSGGNAERVTPKDEPGTHSYEISPNGKIGLHTFSNIYTPYQSEVVSLPDHRHLSGTEIKLNTDAKNKPEFFKVKTVDGVEMDGWMVKPTNFDPSKKYPVVFYVYSEPAGATVTDSYGTGRNGEYIGNMADDGYIYISLDNRGTPAPKGAEWRKSIYKKIGIVNIEDQAMGAKEILKWPFVDSTRVAVWGWSGGGSCTLNLMFQHPEIYKTGIAIAAVGWQLTYDNIYQERYMGVPVDEASRQVFIQGSPITYAKNLRGNLLYIHGTGDDNVHYKNAEMLINELVKYNRQFQLMSYPNRSHGIYEGPGTTQHLRTLYTQYLKEHCPPGGR